MQLVKPERYEEFVSALVSLLHAGLTSQLGNAPGAAEQLVVVIDCRGGSSVGMTRHIGLLKKFVVTMSQHYPVSRRVVLKAEAVGRRRRLAGRAGGQRLHGGVPCPSLTVPLPLLLLLLLPPCRRTACTACTCWSCPCCCAGRCTR